MIQEIMHLDEEYAEEQRARSLVLRKLARREYTSIEMLRFLLSEGVSEETSEKVILDLQAERILQDEKYTELFVRAQALKGKGVLWTIKKLAEKGIRVTPEKVEALLQDALSVNEEEIIRQFIQRKYPRATQDPQEARKAISGLIRRGFHYSKIQAVLGRVIQR